MDTSIKRLCSICVRGGSKGVPSKNIRNLYGKPLFVHSIDQAKETGLFDYVVVSSDSEKILDIAKNAGSDLSIKRPKNLADDHSPKLPAIQHCLEISERKFEMKFDVVIDLDATSPLRHINDIKGVVEMIEKSNVNINIITGSLSRRSPYFNLVEVDNKGFVYLSGIKNKWKEIIIYTDETIKIALKILNDKSQIVFVLDKDDKLKGTITDRDIKNGLLSGFNINDTVDNIMNKKPTFIMEDTNEEVIYRVFKKTKLLHLPVVDKSFKLLTVRSFDTFVRRQDTPVSYDLNASIYAWWRLNLLSCKNVITEKTKLYVMPEERSIDIDTELDFKWVEFLMANR